MQELLDAAGLPQPDEVEYAGRCVRLLWWEQKLAVEIELTPPIEDAA
jgi:hypothetical protein